MGSNSHDFTDLPAQCAPDPWKSTMDRLGDSICLSGSDKVIEGFCLFSITVFLFGRSFG
jgi:hypothetical protein